MTIGDVLRALLNGDRLSPDNLAEAEQAVSDFEAQLGALEAPAAAPAAPAVLHVPVTIDAQGNVTQG